MTGKPDTPPTAKDMQSEDRPRSAEPPSIATLEQARRFLAEENVRSASNQQKTEFLKSKGFSDDDIQALLSEESTVVPEPNAQAEPRPDEASEASEAQEHPKKTTQAAASQPVTASSTSDTPPIITYPEFLTHSPRPPPLLTPSRVLNILTVAGTTWTLLYGATRFVVSPMVDRLAESRSEYYEHVNTKLSGLVQRLEDSVTEVPYKNGKPLKASEADTDDGSSHGDPTELFHRDVGTQTSRQASPSPADRQPEKPTDVQARRLAVLVSSLRELTDTYTRQAENSADLHSVMRDVRDDVIKLAYPPSTDYSSLYRGHGFSTTQSDPEDEIKKTKDAIRSVKGMFLSSRMFPAAAVK